MRTLLTLALVLGLATSAAAEGCVTVTIGHADDDPLQIESVEGRNDSVRFADGGGPYLWFTWNLEDGQDSIEGDTVSFDVSDPNIVSAVGCPNGDVTINRAEPAPEPAPEAPTTTVAETVNVIEVHPELFGSFGRYLMD